MRLPLAAALVLALMAPWSPATGADRVFRAAPQPCHAGHVALTFDDGPSPTVTPRLLSTLKRLDVPATFFMVGSRVDAAPATARLVERSGFLIGNHSYAHEDLTGESEEAVRDSIRRTAAGLTRAGVQPTDLMRPPYGAVDPPVLAAIRAEHDVPVLWTVDPRDWESGDSAQIASRILGQLHPGNQIVLQHDGVGNSPSSIAAVPAIVQEARRRGYCFTGLDDRGRPGFPQPAARLDVPWATRHVQEGGKLRLTITLAGEAGRDTSVRLVFGSLGASLGQDLGPAPRVVRFPAGTLSRIVAVPVVQDQVAEGKERFTVRLSDGGGVRPERGKTTIVIEDRDG